MAFLLILKFQYPQAFWGLVALLPLLLLYQIARLKKKKIIEKLGNPQLIQGLIGNYSAKNNLIKFILAGSALILLITAIANIQLPGKNNASKRKGHDLFIALDLSTSMLADDVKPNRLEKARMLIRQLLDESQNDRIGLIVFAGHPYLQMPLSNDHAAALMYVQQARPEQLFTQGTAIGEALSMGASAFQKYERKYKTILLITDGENHDAEAEKLLPSLREKGIMVVTVGIGTPAGSSVPDPVTGSFKKDDAGSIVQSKLNEALLKDIADKTGGRYIRLAGINEAVASIRTVIDHMEQYAFEDDTLSDRESYFQWFLFPALLFLLIELIWPEKKSSIKKFKVGLLIPLAFSFLDIQAQEGIKRMQAGDQFYQDKKLNLAVEQYRLAAEDPSTHAHANYNLGVCYFRMNDFESAENAFDEALKTNKEIPLLIQRSLYNKGVLFSRQNKLEESIAYYKKALSLNPADKDCRFNLQKALEEKRKKEKENKKNSEQKTKNPPVDPKSMEQWLKSLQQKEQEIQQKLPPKGRSSKQPDKDW
jgi:Ca-activated chloride channel family protein